MQGTRPSRHTVIVVGAGFAGLAVGIQLKQRGITSFLILDKGDDLGGTWRDNVYPGASCDIPSHLYSYSFAPYRDASVRYPGQPQILDYLRGCADRYGVRPHLRTGVTIESASYDDGTCTWHLGAADGTRYEADMVVFALGQLHLPNVPAIPGQDEFSGASFHSARWNRRVDLTGQRVAVIGNGSSAAQIVPGIVDQVASMHVFHRSAAYVLPKPSPEFRPPLRSVLRVLPGLHQAYRSMLFWRSELVLFSALRRHRIAGVLAAAARKHLHDQISDQALRAKLTPDYPIGCKRLLLASDYYPALSRPNVEVIRDEITQITADGIHTADGRERRLDTIIYATGFRTTEFLASVEVTGAEGVRLHDRWKQGVYAYLGMMVDGFPNMFLMYGPHTNLGHNSVLLALESQADYIAQSVVASPDRGAGAWDVRPERMAEWRRLVDGALDGLVWTDQCTSWFKDASGRVSTNWPYRTPRYQRMVRRRNPADFRFRPVRRAVEPAT
ncbi:NAD(P)/FAD-dependent oxidoreductase [Micromonospora sp. NPDC049230]|uniref:flavin-containing monooxygenase n=1 Tax=Micromonospora sp. NPDC049230 TaxID=3155502 RepID=UPI003405DC7F